MAIRFASRHFVPIRIALIVAVAFARLLLPAGYMPGAAVAAEDWGGFVICYGAGNEARPDRGTDPASAHRDCPFGLAHHVALANPPAEAEIPAPRPAGAATPTAETSGLRSKSRNVGHGARAPPSANDEIQIHIV